MKGILSSLTLIESNEFKQILLNLAKCINKQAVIELISNALIRNRNTCVINFFEESILDHSFEENFDEKVG
jgi:hypothetical protein